MSCPLCACDDYSQYDKDKLRHYFLCSDCGLVYVPRDELISSADEKKRYDAHENDADDSGYVSYLKGIADSVKVHLKEGERGLDFGCGRTKLLSELLKPYFVESYDLYFYPDEELLKTKFDFVILSEVIEHLRNPGEVMNEISKKAPKLFIKTKWYPETGFSQWFYKRDMTHVQFFNSSSFQKLAEMAGFKQFEEIGKDLYLFTK